MEEQTIKFLNRVFWLAAVLIVGILVFFVGQLAYQSNFLERQNQHQITVSGEGKVYAKPDLALISLGVTTQAATVVDVTKTNTEKMNAVIDAVKNLGVDEKDIQTTNYSLSPNYEIRPVPMMYPAPSVSRIIKGYTLEQDVQVKIRDFGKIGDILSQATAKGANQVGDLQFTIDNPEQYKEQAREKAIQQAKSNAQDLARVSGINLGKIINVYENYFYPGVYNKAVGLSGGAAESAPAPTIQPGQQEIDVTINLTYQVK